MVEQERLELSTRFRFDRPRVATCLPRLLDGERMTPLAISLFGPHQNGIESSNGSSGLAGCAVGASLAIQPTMR